MIFSSHSIPKKYYVKFYHGSRVRNLRNPAKWKDILIRRLLRFVYLSSSFQITQFSGAIYEQYSPSVDNYTCFYNRGALRLCLAPGDRLKCTNNNKYDMRKSWYWIPPIPYRWGYFSREMWDVEHDHRPDALLCAQSSIYVEKHIQIGYAIGLTDIGSMTAGLPEI